MVFEINKIYKLKVLNEFNDIKIYTLTIIDQDDIFLYGIDKFDKKRGINKQKIQDFKPVDEQGGEI